MRSGVCTTFMTSVITADLRLLVNHEEHDITASQRCTKACNILQFFFTIGEMGLYRRNRLPC
jgi:hypothetical protein